MIILTNIKTFDGQIFTTKTGAGKFLGVTSQIIRKRLKEKKLFRKVWIISEAEITKNKAKNTGNFKK